MTPEPSDWAVRDCGAPPPPKNCRKIGSSNSGLLDIFTVREA